MKHLRLAAFFALLLPTLVLAQDRRKSEPIRVIELSGSPADIAAGYGQALAPEMKLLYEKYLKSWFTDDRTYRRAQAASFLFRNQLRPEHKAELTALATAAQIDPGDLMLANCFLDLTPINACSTITLPASAAADGVARFGRNLDFPAMNIADKYSVLLVVRPNDGRHAYAAVSWPGLIGVLTGMNEHGLTLANMEVDRPMGLPKAMPYTLLYRTVLERCKTVDEAVKLLDETPRQTPNNLMLMDAAGNRAVVELTPEKITVRRGLPDLALISTNHHRGEEQQQPGMCRRYDYLRKTADTAHGRIDVPSIESMLGKVQQGKMTLQSMVFEPSNRTMYLSLGSEAATREYQKVDLKTYFTK
jgi:isopenicillin-N N-acyltransferase like protein